MRSYELSGDLDIRSVCQKPLSLNQPGLFAGVQRGSVGRSTVCREGTFIPRVSLLEELSATPSMMAVVPCIQPATRYLLITSQNSAMLGLRFWKTGHSAEARSARVSGNPRCQACVWPPSLPLWPAGQRQKWLRKEPHYYPQDGSCHPLDYWNSLLLKSSFGEH